MEYRLIHFHSARAWLAFGFVLFWLASARLSSAAEFIPAEKITDGARRYRLSRAANGHLGLDSTGRLHAVYWSGGIQTTPLFPSFVYYRSWTLEGGWGAQISIDDSTVTEGHIGGRHPSLTVTADDKVWVGWHGHRHATGPTWIDNIEIYADSKPSGGSFSSVDIRLTTSTAISAGDNGYTPKIVEDASGRLSVSWYDFHQDAGVSDVYLKRSDEFGVFDTAESMASMQLTDKNGRGGSPPFTVPDLAIDGSGTLHLVWAGGSQADVDLYYAEAPPGASSVSEIILASGATDFFDPAHITVAPNGDVWVAYGDDAAIGNENVVLRRRRSGQSDFDPPITILPDAARQLGPDHEVDSAGLVHLVWIDERFGRHIYYALYDPEEDVVIEEDRLTDQPSSAWTRPTLTLGPDGSVFVLFEESLGLAAGDIWFTMAAGPMSRVRTGLWQRYD